MTIIEKIKQSIETATGLPFIYHAAGEINELLTKAKSLPIAYSFLIDSGTVQSVNGNYHEQITLAVMFCDKTEFDFNAIENEQIIDTMKVKAYKWLQSLRDNSNALRIVSVNSTQRLYDNTTAILTGYAVNITLQDTSGEGDCTLPDVVIPIESNGEYNVVGVDKVDVNVVPKLQELEITENGEYLPPTDIAGFSKVNVNVQPQLEELTITQDGEYLPQEGVDGFSKVVAEFDTSSLPKARASLLRINNNCIDDNGQWIGGELVDFSAITSMSQFARGCKVENFDNVSWNFPTSSAAWDYAFNGCTKLTHLDFTHTNKTKVTNLWGTFGDTYILKELKGLDKLDVSGCSDFASFITQADCEEIDITSWDFGSATRIASVFYFCSKLKSFIGNKTIDDVLSNDIKAFANAKVSINIGAGYANAIERPSLRALINGLADLTGQTALTLTLGATLIAKLTEEDIAVATNKNWTIA